MHRKIVGALCLGMLLVSPAWAQKNNRNKQDEKRENERVADAQKEVREQQKDLSDAEQKLREAVRSSTSQVANLARAREQLRQTREQTADRLAKSMGIEAALERLKLAKMKLVEFKTPVIEKLHRSKEWVAATDAADKAQSEIDKLREDIELSDDDRKQKLDRLTKLVLRPDELDRQAVVETAEGKLLTDQVEAALAAIEKIRRAIPDEKVDADPAVVQAKKTLEKSEQELKKLTQNVSAQRNSVQKAQQQLQQSRQKLQQAQAADARDKNRK